MSMNYFDVPAQSYGDGWSTGMEAAAQFMDALRDNPRRDFALWVLEEVAKAAGEESEESRRGAAVGFLRMIEAMLRAAARDYDGGRWIRERREEHDLCRAALQEKEREMNAERAADFIARMKAAKQAKRVQAQECSAA